MDFRVYKTITDHMDFAVLSRRCSAPELNDFLRSFYAELCQGNGGFYAKRSMITLRYSLQRHFLKHRQFDICKDAAFEGCNEMFKAILHKLKAEGKRCNLTQGPGSSLGPRKFSRRHCLSPGAGHRGTEDLASRTEPYVTLCMKKARVDGCMQLYDNVPVGLHTLGNKMSVISKQAQCSKVYTNHCFCATAINKLDNAGFEARHIMAISGHHSENSIKHYSRVGESQKRRKTLTIASNNEKTASCSSTTSKFVRISSTATTSNIPQSPSPPQAHAQSSQLVVNSQPTSSPININSSVSCKMHLHFHNCKVKIVCNKK
nr:uncharacterized protein LOC129255358 [Lytechinus pictus]